ncbi:MAG: flavin reductase family protein, partial [Pseudomonadota bacterium]
TVPCPRVRDVPAALECRVTDIMQPSTLAGDKSDYIVVFGQVTGVFIDDAHIADGRFDLAKADPIMRAGYRDYMRGGELLELVRPDD